jgi:H/ACA ribonucleoprotein complex non-core subunit NAF1
MPQESSDDDDDDDDDDENLNKQKTIKITYPKTKGEITIDELPVPDFQHFTLNENETMSQIGIVSSIVNNMIVVQSNRNSKPLDEDTILFTSDRHTIGKVYETFGPVCQPYYSVRVNLSENPSCACKYELNTSVFYVPNSQELTKYIFNIEQLKTYKGSDASWSNDNEPPVECLDYSDDEQEKLTKQRLKASKHQSSDDVAVKKVKPNNPRPNFQQQQPQHQQQQFRPRNHNFNSFRQPFFMQQPQLINQSFQQMMSPNMYQNMPPNQYYQQMNQHQRPQFNRPYMRPNYNYVDQRFIQDNELKKSF